MCAGMAVLLGPPSVGGGCYLVWLRGKARVWSRLKLEPPETAPFGAGIASAGSLVGAYLAQRAVLLHHSNLDLLAARVFSCPAFTSAIASRLASCSCVTLMKAEPSASTGRRAPIPSVSHSRYRLGSNFTVLRDLPCLQGWVPSWSRFMLRGWRTRTCLPEHQKHDGPQRFLLPL